MSSSKDDVAMLTLISEFLQSRGLQKAEEALRQELHNLEIDIPTTTTTTAAAGGAAAAAVAGGAASTPTRPKLDEESLKTAHESEKKDRPPHLAPASASSPAGAAAGSAAGSSSHLPPTAMARSPGSALKKQHAAEDAETPKHISFVGVDTASADEEEDDDDGDEKKKKVALNNSSNNDDNDGSNSSSNANNTSNNNNNNNSSNHGEYPGLRIKSEASSVHSEDGCRSAGSSRSGRGSLKSPPPSPPPQRMSDEDDENEDEDEEEEEERSGGEEGEEGDDEENDDDDDDDDDDDEEEEEEDGGKYSKGSDKNRHSLGDERTNFEIYAQQHSALLEAYRDSEAAASGGAYFASQHRFGLGADLDDAATISAVGVGALRRGMGRDGLPCWQFDRELELDDEYSDDDDVGYRLIPIEELNEDLMPDEEWIHFEYKRSSARKDEEEEDDDDEAESPLARSSSSESVYEDDEDEDDEGHDADEADGEEEKERQLHRKRAAASAVGIGSKKREEEGEAKDDKIEKDSSAAKGKKKGDSAAKEKEEEKKKTEKKEDEKKEDKPAEESPVEAAAAAAAVVSPPTPAAAEEKKEEKSEDKKKDDEAKGKEEEKKEEKKEAAVAKVDESKADPAVASPAAGEAESVTTTTSAAASAAVTTVAPAPAATTPSEKPVEGVAAEEDTVYFDCFDLKIVYERNKTGFEEHKDFPIRINSIIAGRYQILQYLGSAAFSKAVQCIDLHDLSYVCIKIIKNNKEYFDQSLDEIKLLKYINANDPDDSHNVLQLYDYFYFKEHLFIVTELLRENLYEFSKFNRESEEPNYFTIPRLQKITRQCMEACSFVHSLGLIHCDLKPENILIRSYSRCLVKVIDFGSSCFVTDHLTSYVQSRSYRAPEVILGMPYDSKIDMWSMGCILAELWTGRVLFHNESVATLLGRVSGIIGPFNRKWLRRGRYTNRLFTRNLVLFDRSPEDPTQIVCIVPKKTTLKERLHTEDELFLDFVSSLLKVNPDERLSAAEALQHPWLAHQYDEAV